MEQHEVLQRQNEVRGVLKPLQQSGVGIKIADGGVSVQLPEGGVISPERNKLITEYVNAIAPELSGVSGQSVVAIVGALEKFRQGDPLYQQDIIMYGPAVENDGAEKRMQRLVAVRQSVTQAQMESQPGGERVQAVKAATFVRTHLPDLGLNTTINYLNALR